MSHRKRSRLLPGRAAGFAAQAPASGWQQVFSQSAAIATVAAAAADRMARLFRLGRSLARSNLSSVAQWIWAHTHTLAFSCVPNWIAADGAHTQSRRHRLALPPAAADGTRAVWTPEWGGEAREAAKAIGH